MADFLKQMAALSAERAAAVRRTFSDDALDRPAFPLTLDRFDLIAEIKNRSPAEGELASGAGQRADRARTYAQSGAAAISVLTEPNRFDGALAHLEEVAGAVAADEVPVMRKDFIVDPVQVLEAKAAGASGVLLIIAMTPGKELLRLLDCALEHDLFALIEAFDERDIDVAVSLLDQDRYRQKAADNKLLVGVNSRDLRTLQVDAGRLGRLGPVLPDACRCVAESGLRTGEDASKVAGRGYQLALVGTALMRAADPGELISSMLAAGRSGTPCS
jgi:indole-3-glycerol phosphate synthase